MRRNRVVSRQYAKVLFQIAESESKEKKFLDELEAFLLVLRQNKEVENFFLNPTLDRSTKKTVLEGIESQLPETEKFIKLVVERNRIEYFEDMVSEFHSLMDEHSGEVAVDLEVARKPSDNQLQEISKIIENQFQQKPRIEIKEDNKILGGFIARTKSRTLDASLQLQLKKLETELSRSA